MAKKSFEEFVAEHTEDNEGFWMVGDGDKLRLPKIGARCLFSLRKGAPINGHACPANFRVFGYMIDKDEAYLPIYHQRIHVGFLEAWKPAEGPDYWNGSNRSTSEAFR